MPKLDTFNFSEGDELGWKYEVIDLLGRGWEGEVYRIRERGTGIDHAAKFFFPQRNVKNRAFKFYAKKLHKLRNCPILIRYYTQELLYIDGHPVSYLISEYVDGQILQDFLESRPGGRLTPYQGLHLLYAMAKGLEPIHKLREYHGDLHTKNIIVQNWGLSFDLKALDLYQYGTATAEHLFDDVCDMIRVFYDAIGGERFYSKHPAEVKSIVCGLKRSVIQSKFKNAMQLRSALDSMSIQSRF